MAKHISEKTLRTILCPRMGPSKVGHGCQGWGQGSLGHTPALSRRHPANRPLLPGDQLVVVSEYRSSLMNIQDIFAIYGGTFACSCTDTCGSRILVGEGSVSGINVMLMYASLLRCCNEGRGSLGGFAWRSWILACRGIHPRHPSPHHPTPITLLSKKLGNPLFSDYSLLSRKCKVR